MHVAKTQTKEKIVLFGFAILLTFLVIEIGFADFVLSVSQQITNIKTGIFQDKNEEAYRILTLGESTSVGLGYDSWPMQLEKVLNNKSKKIKFKVYNEAAGGVNTLYLLGRLEENIKKYKPHMVITMMGINDWRYPCCTYTEKNNSISSILNFFKGTKSYRMLHFLVERIIKSSKAKEEREKKVTFSDSVIEVYTKQEKLQKEDILTLKNEDTNMILTDDFFLDQIYLELGYKAKKKGNYNLSLTYFIKSADINQKNDEAYLQAGWIYRDFYDDYTMARTMFQKAIKANPDNAQAAFALIDISKEETGTILEKYYNIHSSANHGLGEFNLTASHYRKLYGILHEKNITYAAMQYPTLDISLIKGFFSQNEQPNILFIENRLNFIEVLSRDRYERYFFDEFAFDKNASKFFYGNFGHATSEGNKIIAENSANKILDYLNISN